MPPLSFAYMVFRKSLLKVSVLLAVTFANAQTKEHRVGLSVGLTNVRLQDLLLSPFQRSVTAFTTGVQYERLTSKWREELAISFTSGKLKTSDQKLLDITLGYVARVRSFPIGDNASFSPALHALNDFLIIPTHGAFTEPGIAFVMSGGIGIQSNHSVGRGALQLEAVGFPITYGLRPRYANAPPESHNFFQAGQLLGVAHARRWLINIDYAFATQKTIRFKVGLQFKYWSIDLPSYSLRNNTLISTLCLSAIWSSKGKSLP